MSRPSSGPFLLLCCVVAGASLWSLPRAHGTQARDFHGWHALVPSGWTRLPLDATEQSFTERFPGRIARFGKGTAQLVVRHIERPSRRVHPSSHCLEASGYTLRRVPSSSAKVATWIATRGAHRMRVEEWFTSSDGQQHGDITAWYWSALLGYSRGPWVAYTRSTPLPAL